VLGQEPPSPDKIRRADEKRLRREQKERDRVLAQAVAAGITKRIDERGQSRPTFPASRAGTLIDRQRQSGAHAEDEPASRRPQGPNEVAGIGLMSQPVLAFRGQLHRQLRVFDLDANQIGLAVRRFRASELRDIEGNPLLAVKKRRWFVLYSTYVVRRPDGKEICSIGHPRLRLRHTVRPLRRRGNSLGSLKLGCLGSNLATLEDRKGDETATIVRKKHAGGYSYVVDIAPSAEGSLKTIAIAASIVWDLATHDLPEGEGGG